MTKKDYERMASAVRYLKLHRENTEAILPMLRFLRRLCIELHQDNPNFNKSRFLTACALPIELIQVLG